MNTVPDFDFETANTRRMLERLPQSCWNYKPHDSSMSMLHLATHIIRLMRIGESTVREASFDLATGENIPDPANPEELLRDYDEHVAALKSAIAAAPGESWNETWHLTHGEHVVRSLPRGVALRIVWLNHTLHHRAQLSVYLRVNGVPVPGMYGPSADER